MNPIQPITGRAAEYAPYHINIYETCPHGCRYCYVPHMTPCRVKGMKADDFHQPARKRPDLVLDLLEQLRRRKGAPAGTVLLSFFSDPYPRMLAAPDDAWTTREVLAALRGHTGNVAVLTKGGVRAARDFDLLALEGWWFGQTITLTNEDAISYPDCGVCPLGDEACVTGDEDEGHCVMAGWEPYAAPFADREAAAQIAHDVGIPTWVSVEPVINANQALDVIDRLMPYVDHWKIGKLNGRDEETRGLERSIDWPRFLSNARHMLRSYTESAEPGAFARDTVYFKHALLEAATEK